MLTRMWGRRRRRPPGSGPPEVTSFMFEPDALDPPHAPSAGLAADDEPPSRPGRHPAWRDDPDDLWDDWRWQTHNSVRSVRQLRHLLPFAPDELEALGRLEADYKLAVPP